MKVFRFLLQLLLLVGALHAQQYDNPVQIPVAFYGNGNVTYIPTGQSASFSFGASVGAVSSVSTSTASPGSMIYSNLATTTLVPGQVYTVTVTSQYMSEVVVNFQPCPNYQIVDIG